MRDRKKHITGFCNVITGERFSLCGIDLYSWEVSAKNEKTATCKSCIRAAKAKKRKKA